MNVDQWLGLFMLAASFAWFGRRPMSVAVGLVRSGFRASWDHRDRFGSTLNAFPKGENNG